MPEPLIPLNAPNEIEPYSRAWYATQFRHLQHCYATQKIESLDQFQAIVNLRNRSTALEARHLDDIAKIGELQSRIEELEQWRAKIVPWLLSQMKSVKPSDPSP